MIRILKAIFRSARSAWLRLRLARLGEAAYVDLSARIDFPRRVVIGSGSRIEHRSVVRGNTSHATGIRVGSEVSVKDYAIINANAGHVSIGDRSWIGPHCVIYGNGGVEIGNDVLIAAHTSITTVSHIAERVDVPINDQGISCDPVIIENDVWLGLNCTILQGVTIGSGSIIGAGAVVTKDIPRGSIALGVPARVVGHRAPQSRSGRRLLEAAS